ncbi:MAG: hypothetical protein ACOY0T_14560 [Myxococcota bacterium]
MQIRWACLVALGALSWGCELPPSDLGVGGSGGGGGSANNAGAGGALTITTLPDGTSCGPAPADAPGASYAWGSFLDWHDANYAVCGSNDKWFGYDCLVRIADPRRVSAFANCLMADGCSSIFNADACVANPENPALGYQLTGAANAWYQNVCVPRSVACGFSVAECNVFSPVLRPEMRCAFVECIQGPCENVTKCFQVVRSQFGTCSVGRRR